MHRLEVVPLPDAANAGWRDRKRFATQLVGHADLAPCGLLYGGLEHRSLDVWHDPILGHRLAAADLSQRFLAPGLVQLFEAVEAVSTVAKHLTCLGGVAQLLSQLK